MSANGTPQPPAAPAETVEIAAQMVIQLTAAGQVMVHGPLANKVLCYGLLESAKDAIRNAEAQRETSPIVRPTLVPFGRG